MRRSPEPAEVAWALILAEVAVVDVALLCRGHLALSTVCRRSMLARALVVYVAVHLVCSVPGDPLSLLGRKLSRRAGEASR